MGRTYDGISDDLGGWIRRQHMFFVASAPLASDGHVNLSPKGLDTFAVLSPTRVAYLDLTGSGVETIAHLRENGRITVMFCAFDGPPRIVRLWGRGSVVSTTDEGFDELAARWPAYPGARAVIDIKVDRVGDSCGFAVPRLDFRGDRQELIRWAEKRGPDGVADYLATRNAVSIDGLAGYPAPAPSPDPTAAG